MRSDTARVLTLALIVSTALIALWLSRFCSCKPSNQGKALSGPESLRVESEQNNSALPVRHARHTPKGTRGHTAHEQACPLITIITTSKISKERQRNIDALVPRFWPCPVGVVKGFQGNQNRTIEYLARAGIHISPSYYGGEKDILNGKIGLWASFLSFCDNITSSNHEYGIFVEDDAVVPREVAQKAMTMRRSNFVMHLGGGNQVDLVTPSLGYDRLKHLLRDGIPNPLDITLSHWKLRTKAGIHNVQEMHPDKRDSGIVHSGRVMIAEYNRWIQNYRYS